MNWVRHVESYSSENENTRVHQPAHLQITYAMQYLHTFRHMNMYRHTYSNTKHVHLRTCMDSRLTEIHDAQSNHSTRNIVRRRYLVSLCMPYSIYVALHHCCHCHHRKDYHISVYHDHYHYHYNLQYRTIAWDNQCNQTECNTIAVATTYHNSSWYHLQAWVLSALIHAYNTSTCNKFLLFKRHRGAGTWGARSRYCLSGKQRTVNLTIHSLSIHPSLVNNPPSEALDNVTVSIFELA